MTQGRRSRCSCNLSMRYPPVEAGGVIRTRQNACRRSKAGWLDPLCSQVLQQAEKQKVVERIKEKQEFKDLDHEQTGWPNSSQHRGIKQAVSEARTMKPVYVEPLTRPLANTFARLLETHQKIVLELKEDT